MVSQPSDSGIVEDQRIFPNGAVKYNSIKPDKASLAYAAGSMHNAAVGKGHASAYHYF
jgi:hypothetical protein